MKFTFDMDEWVRQKGSAATGRINYNMFNNLYGPLGRQKGSGATDGDSNNLRPYFFDILFRKLYRKFPYF